MLSTCYTKGIDYIHIRGYALPFDKLATHAGMLYMPTAIFGNWKRIYHKHIDIYFHSR